MMFGRFKTTSKETVDFYLDIYRLQLMKRIRISKETLCVLERFLTQPSDWRYGYELSRETGLKSGTLYPILMRLEKHSLLEARWVMMDEGVPPRHTYRLTPAGLELARANLAEARRKGLIREPVLHKV
ncbi:MAG: PadR family transcriptional regulator [Terriglobia bacterium]